MRGAIVRLSGISIQNIKNVRKGELNFCNNRKDYRASVLGMYGQNGSGKTTLIDAIQILKDILCRKPIEATMADYINVDAPYALLEYDFDVRTPIGRYKAYYEFKLRIEEYDPEQNMDDMGEADNKSRIVLFDEILSYSFEGKSCKIRKSRFIDTTRNQIFGPETKYDSLVGREEDVRTDLLVARKLAEQTSRSFVFSGELLNVARKHGLNMKQDEEEYMRHMKLMEALVFYGCYELFVINSRTVGVISMNILPLAFKYEEEGRKAAGMTLLPLEEPTVIRQETMDIVDKVIKNMNIVLDQMVPGLTIELKDLGNQVMKNGDVGKRIQLMSNRNAKLIPLKNESDGIKKIVMILQLLIAVYNQESITVAIDELDSGVFEYLLGEVVRIVSEKGKGQLIFTSHNLRPLETLDRGFIAFTTTNPNNRYVRMMNVKDNNNLRDLYYRDIVLGGNNQAEELYEPTHNAEIALAFREAGEMFGE